jgi:hypothetical protein
MKHVVALAASLACLAGGAVTAQAGAPEVSYAGSRLTIRCTQTPLADVLDRVQAATGLELFLDEAVGRTRVSAEIDAQPVSTALEGLLEGSGIAYAMTLDPDGVRVSRMFVGNEAKARPVGGPGPSVAAARPVVVPRLPRRPAPEPAASTVATPAPSPQVSAADEDEDDIDEMDDDTAETLAGLAEENAHGSVAAPGTPGADSKVVMPAQAAPIVLENPAPVPPDQP